MYKKNLLPKIFCAVSLVILFVVLFKVLGNSGQEFLQEEAVTVFAAKNERELVPVGITVGVRFYTKGIMVLSTGEVEDIGGRGFNPSEGKLVSGDIIQKAQGKEVANIAELIDIINTADKEVSLQILRGDDSLTVEILPKMSPDGQKRIGCWARDSTQGIGTITYYDPKTGHFGALGHGIMDVDTKKLMVVKEGNVFEAHIVDIRKGQKGNPGELVGEIFPSITIGEIDSNSSLGIFGDINMNYQDLPHDAMPIASHADINTGPAKIRSDIEGGEIKEYDVFIESVNTDGNADKGLVVRITDQGLITRTNGIVQGMSGSPILQNGKLIGAVTHVFVQNPLRGYGVFIENMLKQQQSKLSQIEIALIVF